MMGEQYLGKILTKELAQELHEKGIDPWWKWWISYFGT
jgi:hypothetical protein